MCNATQQTDSREKIFSYSPQFTFDIYELLLRQGLAIHRVRPILGDILFDQPALKHLVRHRGDAWVLRHLVGDCNKIKLHSLKIK